MARVKQRSATSRRPTRRRLKKTSMSTKSFKKAVRVIAKSEAQKLIEDKQYITPVVGDTYGSGPTQFGNVNFETNNVIDVSNETLNLITQAQGLTQNGRIGNRLKLKSCVIRGTLTPNQAQIVPHYLKIWILSSKLYVNTADVATIRTICQNNFFKTSPTSGSAGMTGQLIDLCRTVNDEQVTVYYTKVFKIGFFNLPNNALLPSGNNDFSYGRTFKFYLGRHMNKNIIYNDNAAEPRNKKLFVVMEAIPADSSVANNNSYGILNYFIEMKYEDA